MPTKPRLKHMGMDIFRWPHSAALSPVHTAPEPRRQESVTKRSSTNTNKAWGDVNVPLTVTLGSSKKRSGQNERSLHSSWTLNQAVGGRLLLVHKSIVKKETKNHFSPKPLQSFPALHFPSFWKKSFTAQHTGRRNSYECVREKNSKKSALTL